MKAAARGRPERGAVCAPHPAAAAAGAEMLRAGGNAVDAAIATAFALTVVNPSNTGVAGYGGVMVIYLADRDEAVAMDFTCQAPAGARPDMFPIEKEADDRIHVVGRIHEHGGLAVEVSGMVAGLTLAQERFGSLPLETVMRPAIAAARDGFEVDEWTAARVPVTLVPNAERYPEALALHLIDGRPPRAGERLRNPELAETLARIAREGAAAFYRGEVARAIVETVQRHGGVLTLEDLAAYRPIVSDPLAADFRGRRVLTVPGTCGGLTVLQQLRVLEGLEPVPAGDEVGLMHLLAEVSKVCWRERLTRVGDPAFVPLDPAVELGERRVRGLRAEVAEGLGAPQAGKVIAPDPLLGTIHLCTADARGNVVSLTHTHGGNFGSLVTVPGTGLVLSHGMSRFDPRPGWPNSVAPGKRPAHNMTPLILMREGRPELAIGGAGGRTILSNVLYTVARCLDWGEDLESVLAAPRFHVETAEPVQIESGAEHLAEGMAALGHQVSIKAPFGSLQGIRFGGDGVVMAAADRRRAGAAAVV